MQASPPSVGQNGPGGEGGAVEHERFNLHASVQIGAEDDRGRERLCRYGARPPFSLERFRVLPAGRIAYRIKTLGVGRAKYRVMTPLELLARLAALVPPPRYPLVRYHGVLAPHAAWRREIAPRPPLAPSSRHGVAPTRGTTESCRISTCVDARPARAKAASRVAGPACRDGASSRRPAVSPRSNAALGAVAEQDRARLHGERAGADRSALVTSLAPNILSVRHWSHLLGGLLYATSPRLRWPELLRRTFDVDVLECPTCHGRIRILEAVVETETARRILERLGLSVDSPRLVRARDRPPSMASSPTRLNAPKRAAPTRARAPFGRDQRVDTSVRVEISDKC
ncbi:MAG TPA: transposase [Labilithrix sp.]|nr:transposase [Labilithrix sp.]